MKHNKFMITVLCVILLSGCGGGQDLPSVSPSASPSVSPPVSPPVSPSASPSANISPEKTSFLPLVENDPLLDLSPEEFEIEYAKLPDDYEIKIANKFATDSLQFDEGYDDPFDFGESRIITKKQAEAITDISTYYKEEYFGGEMSLKGLRYFPNVEGFAFTECNLSNLDELYYLNKLERLYFSSCGFELEETTEILRNLLLSGRITSLFVCDCGLTNLDFLKGISNLSDVELWFGNNQISDITALSDLTKIYQLQLYDNQITDFTPLSNLKEVNVLSLSDNQITDLTPLSHLTEIDRLDLRNNQITDLTPLSNLKKVEELFLSNNPITDISPLKNLKFADSDSSCILLKNLDIDYDLAKRMFGDYIRMED